MGLVDELKAPPRKAKSFAAWLIEQTPEDRKALEAAATDPRWSSFALQGLLRKYGAACSRESVIEWRLRCGYVPE